MTFTAAPVASALAIAAAAALSPAASSSGARIPAACGVPSSAGADAYVRTDTGARSKAATDADPDANAGDSARLSDAASCLADTMVSTQSAPRKKKKRKAPAAPASPFDEARARADAEAAAKAKAELAAAIPGMAELESKGYYLLSLIKGGRLVHMLNLTKITDKIQPNTIIVWDPFSDDESAFRAFRFNILLTIFFGHGWQEWDEVVFKADDGYEAAVPVERFVKHTSYLAFSKPDKGEFSHVDKINDRGNVPLGPYYLTWENLQDLTMKDEGAVGWVPRIRSVELVRFDERYPLMAPPKGSKSVRDGFLAYRKHCMACHTINGEGGKKGDSSQKDLLELNFPVSVTEFFKEDWLERWIDNPAEIRYSTKMPRLDPKLRDRDLVIKDMLAYLQAMAQQKRIPANR